MKRFYFFVLINLFAFQLFASDLVLITTNSYTETTGLFQNPALKINFFKDQFVIATLDGNPKPGFIQLDKNAWQGNSSYYLVYLENQTRAQYLTQLSGVADVLFDGGERAAGVAVSLPEPGAGEGAAALGASVSHRVCG